MSNNISILYISIIGMSEPLGKSQVLEYLKALSSDYDIYLHSFEKSVSDAVLNEIQLTMDSNDINWSYQLYDNRWGVISSVLQIVSSFVKLLYVIRRSDIRIIHARSLIPVVIGMLLKVFSSVKIIFDIRGFQVDEKAEVGRLNHSSNLYSLLKFLEKMAYKNSDAIVSLTHNAKHIISNITNESKISVIPTCANRKIFRRYEASHFKRDLGYADTDKVILHVGAVANWYDFDSELTFVKKLMRKDETIRFLVLNKGEHQFIERKSSAHNIDMNKLKVLEVNFYEMYKYLNMADASIFFIHPTYSKKASAPTKFAENLCCHLFSITNNDIGDMNMYFSKYPDVGCSIDIKTLHQDLSGVADQVLQRLDKSDKESAQYETLYERHMSNDLAISTYSSIYKELLSAS